MVINYAAIQEETVLRLRAFTPDACARYEVVITERILRLDGDERGKSDETTRVLDSAAGEPAGAT